MKIKRYKKMSPLGIMPMLRDWPNLEVFRVGDRYENVPFPFIGMRDVVRAELGEMIWHKSS
jgi:hypothetical protein